MVGYCADPLWVLYLFWIPLSVDTGRIEGCVCLCFPAQSDTKNVYFSAKLTFKCYLYFLGFRMGWEETTFEYSVCVCVNCSYCKRKLLMYNWRKKRSTQNKVCASLFCWSLSLWTMVVLVSIDFLPFNTEVQALKWWLFGFS